MGVFDFIKDVGSRILGDDEPEPQAGPTPDELQARFDERRSVAIARRLKELNLGSAEIKVVVDGEGVHVSGSVPDEETREKVVLAAGNIAGVARVDDNLEVDRPALKASFYSVKPGDSLSKIAKTFYGDASRYPVIFEANRPMLESPDRIFPGQMLRIPPPEIS
jgi:nucleoid-associated protein YgaU